MAKTKNGKWVEVVEIKMSEQEMQYLLASITATLLVDSNAKPNPSSY